MTTMTTTTAVADYGAQVRGHLAGLDPEVVDELTGGLETNLTDALIDRIGAEQLTELTMADLTDRFGTPADYAAELCEAAGITMPVPVRTPSGPRVWMAHLRERTTARWQRFTGRPAGRLAQMVLDSLRPLWWVLRAWVLATAVGLFTGEIDPFRRVMLPTTFVLWLVFLAMLTLSVQWGRQRIGQSRGWRRYRYRLSGRLRCGHGRGCRHG